LVYLLYIAEIFAHHSIVWLIGLSFIIQQVLRISLNIFNYLLPSFFNEFSRYGYLIRYYVLRILSREIIKWPFWVNPFHLAPSADIDGAQLFLIIAYCFVIGLHLHLRRSLILLLMDIVMLLNESHAIPTGIYRQRFISFVINLWNREARNAGQTIIRLHLVLVFTIIFSLVI